MQRDDSSEAPGARRAHRLLAAGAVLGIGLAASGAFQAGAPGGGLPAGAIARVNHRPLRSEDFERTLELLARDKRNPLTDADRAHVLERLIEEELLVQRGVDLGLVESAPSVRKAIVGAMLASIIAEAESRVASEDELRTFYEAEQAYFERPASLRVRQILFRAGSERGDAADRSRRAERAIAGGMAWGEADAAFGDSPLQPLPDAPLSPASLREHIGPSALQAVLALEPGEVSSPLPSPYGQQILRVVERRPPRVPPLEEIRAQVEAAQVRRAGDRALRQYLDSLREEADITLAPEAPR